MKKTGFIFFAIFFVVVFFGCVTSPNVGNSFFEKDLFRNIIVKVKPAVAEVSVNITDTAKNRLIYKRGAGFFVKFFSQTYLITTKHLNKGSTLITVKMESASGRGEFAQKILTKNAYVSFFYDFVSIPLDLSSDIKTDINYLKLADSDKVEEGDIVLTIGNPYGFGKASARGMMSKIKMKNGKRDGFVVDINIHIGNSGGPLVNLEGEVIGIIVAMWGKGNTAIVIPSNIIKEGLMVLKKGGAE